MACGRNYGAGFFQKICCGAGFLKACERDPAGLKRLNFVDKKLVKTINAFIMYKIVSFFHASIDDKKFCRKNDPKIENFG